MEQYLQFKSGDIYSARGRALLYLQIEGQSPSHVHFVDIDGPSLKETVIEEIIQGRLVALDIFEFLYLKIRPCSQNDNLFNMATTEFRDLIHVENTNNTSPEALVQRTAIRYLDIYRENIYIRVLESMANRLFRKSSHCDENRYYITLFRIAGLICQILRARRYKNLEEMEHYLECMNFEQHKLPFLDFSYIKQVLVSGSGAQGQEMADYIDTFYLTLKKDFPVNYQQREAFQIKDSLCSWLEEGLPALYYNFFHHLFNENYEKAIVVKQEISDYQASQSLEGCR